MSVPPTRAGLSTSFPLRPRTTRRSSLKHRTNGVPTLWFAVVLTLSLVPALFYPFARITGLSTSTTHGPAKGDLARMSERVSVHAAGRGNPTINLSDGREVLTSYDGP